MDSRRTKQKAQGARLKTARLAAGFSSARAAAIENNWAESTVRAHEGGWRPIDQDDAERYARRYRLAGVAVTAKSILFGDAPDARASRRPAAAAAADLIQVPQISWVPASKMAEVEIVGGEDAPQIAASGLPNGDWFALRVQGDSMDRIAPDGSIIMANRRDRRLVPRAFYIFGNRGEATFKRFVIKPARMLMPYSNNPTHEPILPGPEFMVIGRVHRVLIDL